MNEFKEILAKYWGYTKFRELQEEIIISVFKGNDTLGLLPTGGGKSITFQVPALAKPGVCLVVTPLIALMKDQVENLRKKNIKANMVFSGMSQREIDLALENACFDPELKFLYLSPERLGTDLFREKIKGMKVNFLVVDEAHCISQWGYDFRPSYLKIAEIRELIPKTPILALTATATPEVVEDIQNKLLFKCKNAIQKSFERKNLTYFVKHTEDKFADLLKISNHSPGTGIVYVRNRKKTVEIANFLRKQKISADFYHAGLDMQTRNKKQEDWKSGKCRIMVSTNAFGMGIDKPDVRFVVHMDLPDSIEAYFQEAGRGGRDEKRSFAVLLVNEVDRMKLAEQVEISFPPIDKIRQVYNALGNYLQVPIGSGKGREFEFSLTGFVSQYKFEILVAFSSLKLLEQEGYITLTDEIETPSRLHFLPNRDELYNFQLRYEKYDAVIKFLLRSYSGLFNDYVRIDEEFLAKRAGISKDELVKIFLDLNKYDVIEYLPRKKSPFLMYTENRLEDKSVIFSPANYRDRKSRLIKRIEHVLNYAFTNNKCRNQLLLLYFGEKNPFRCGVCDVCRQRNELGLSNFEFDNILEKIKQALSAESFELNDLVEKSDYPKEKTVKVIQWLLDHGKISYNKHNRLKWSHTLNENV
ncbi:MAG: RecQ family ATP-dependent DNA helicase [Bacteroidia bacterium]|nr:RecQ family ATP-dependent DNA helicase [Bacteroidia bacterium]